MSFTNFNDIKFGLKVEAPKKFSDQFQSSMKAFVLASRVPNKIITKINCRSFVINYEWQGSKIIGIEMKTSIGFPTNINSRLCRLSLKIENKIIHCKQIK